MPAGRPTDYKPEYCAEAIDYIGHGKSKEAFAGHIGVAVSTVYLWLDKHPEFSEAVKRGEAMSQDQVEINKRLLEQLANAKMGMVNSL
jgi:transposase